MIAWSVVEVGGHGRRLTLGSQSFLGGAIAKLLLVRPAMASCIQVA